MPITIDEVSAEVETPVERPREERVTEARAPSPSDLRRQREYFERLQQRATRVCAN